LCCLQASLAGQDVAVVDIGASHATFRAMAATQGIVAEQPACSAREAPIVHGAELDRTGPAVRKIAPAPMIVDDSPFTPGLPVPTELFVGRDAEITRLSEHVVAAAQGRLRVAFLSGERGIGKSSLAAYVKSYAEQAHNMVGAHVLLGGANTVDEMVRRIFEAILHESRDKKWYDGIKHFFGQTVKQADLFGLKISFSPDQTQLTTLTRNFAQALQELTRKLATDKRAVGFTLVLDNINGLAESQEFADWLKSLIDDIAINRQMPLCLLLVGIDERRESLIELNPSLARSFDLFRIQPWSDKEAAKFFIETYASVGVKVNDQALGIMLKYAGGLPAVAHEIGDAALRVDVDKTIDLRDAAAGVTAAAGIIGQKHIRQQVVDAIRSKKYKSILQKLANKHVTELKFERADLKSMLTQDEASSLDNFLQRMKELGVIVVDDDEGPGSYKFASYILAIYLYMTFYKPSTANPVPHD
jgi:hypothetical protein